MLSFAPVNFRDEKVLAQFGKHLKKLRNQKRITQEDLAYSSNITLSQIARIEIGKINPTLCTLVVIAKTLNLKLTDLIDF